MHALKDKQTTSCSFANKYIAKAAHIQPETKIQEFNAGSRGWLLPVTPKQVDVRSMQHFLVLNNKGW